jgi:MFS transporter, NNP family, nitrate/nitrite transporter
VVDLALSIPANRRFALFRLQETTSARARIIYCRPLTGHVICNPPVQEWTVTLQLILATISFTFCFLAWGLISGLASTFRESFHLSQAQTSLLIALPVLLGALARIPMGMLTDRLGGRLVFSVLMLVSALVVILVPSASTLELLYVVAFFLGLAGSSFAVGAAAVARWTPPKYQGRSLGIYGLGNIGQSLAVFVCPLLAVKFGVPAVFYGTGILLLVWAVAFWLFARDAQATAKPATIGEMMQLLVGERLSWLLAAFYFLTFGGFVSFAIYLPTLLRDQFHLQAADAGFRTAFFVVLATLLRPLGGWLSDRIGGARVLSRVFIGIVCFSAMLTFMDIMPFTVGALGCAALLGIGNGAVFKLVPEIYPRQVGTVSGLVGALGGLGGFFPPILIGLCKQYLGASWPAFALLSLTALILFFANKKVFVSRLDSSTPGLSLPANPSVDRLKAGSYASLVTAVLVAAIVIGSRKLQTFDPALVTYTFATIFAVWGVTYHYYVWLQRPPTNCYWRRGFQLFAAGGAGGVFEIVRVAITHILAQLFISRRSFARWFTHQCIFWGCLIAGAITFPLVFGWVQFGAAAGDQMRYVAYVFGFPAGSFPIRTVFSWLVFHILDFAAVLVIAGVAVAAWRRFCDKGAQATQSFSMDFLPLAMLFAISVTGLALTASTIWFRAAFYDFLSGLHAVAVISALLYLPFGKFFHIFQRPAQLGVKLYQRAGESDAGSFCACCKERYASKMHIEDLNAILPQLGFDYRVSSSASTWQGVCPTCKRRTLALALLKLKEPQNG